VREHIINGQFEDAAQAGGKLKAKQELSKLALDISEQARKLGHAEADKKTANDAAVKALEIQITKMAKEHERTSRQNVVFGNSIARQSIYLISSCKKRLRGAKPVLITQAKLRPVRPQFGLRY